MNKYFKRVIKQLGGETLRHTYFTGGRQRRFNHASSTPQGPPSIGIVLAIGIILLLSGITCVTSFVFYTRLASSSNTVQAYYTALKHQDYVRAFHYFDSVEGKIRLKGKTRPASLNLLKSGDTSLNRIKSVTIHAPVANKGGTILVMVDVVRANLHTMYTVHITLVQMPAGWKIVSVDGV